MNVSIDNNIMTSLAIPSIDLSLLKELAKKFGWEILSTSKSVEQNVISPELQATIDKAREEYRNGETLHFDNANDMNAWLDSL